MSITAPPTPYRAALDARDADALAAACAPGVAFNSPITSRIRFEGREDFRELARTVLDLYDEFRVVEEFGSYETRAVHMHARVGSQELDEVQILRLDDQGRVREITMFVRPLAGLAALTAALGPRLPRRRWRAVLAALLTRPLALMTRLGDRIVVRIVRP